MPSRALPPNLLQDFDANHIPHISVNAVIFGLSAGELKVLLMRWLGVPAWGLPAGYIRWDRDLEAAALDMLRLTTSLDDVHLQQFRTYGSSSARMEGVVDQMNRPANIFPPGHWTWGRVITVAYFTLIDADEIQIRPSALYSDITEQISWRDIRDIPELMLDHRCIVEDGREALRANLDTWPLQQNLLRNPFTMPELQRLYEAVQGRTLDRRNFEKRMVDLKLVELQVERRRTGNSRPARLFRWSGAKR